MKTDCDYHTLTPYIILNDAEAAIRFYKDAFGATERYRLTGLEGRGIMHAEMNFGDTVLMLADECPQWATKSAKSLGGSPTRFVLAVPDAHKAFEKAVQAGCKAIRPVTDMFYGERSGCVEDPFGFVWTVSMHIEDVAPEEMQRRMEEMFRTEAS